MLFYVTHLATLQKAQLFVSAMHFLLNIWDVLLPIGAGDCTKSVEVIETAMSLKTDQAIIKVGTVRQRSQLGNCILQSPILNIVPSAMHRTLAVHLNNGLCIKFKAPSPVPDRKTSILDIRTAAPKGAIAGLKCL